MELKDEIKAVIESGEVQQAIHEQVAPLIQREAGAIVRRGVTENVTTIVVSPWTVTKFIGRKVYGAGKHIVNRLSYIRNHARPERPQTIEAEVVEAEASA